MKNLTLFIILVFVVLSCIPEENPVSPYPRGDAKTAVAGMGIFYENQLYFSFAKDTVIKSNKITDWDLGFSCEPDSFNIILNFAKNMKTFDLGDRDFASVTTLDIPGDSLDVWGHDNSDGYMDSLALGKWYKKENGVINSLKHVYIIDRGSNEKGKLIGYVKFQITNYANNTFSIKFENLKTKIGGSVDITKNELYNFVQVSFDGTGKALELEPPKTEWDLLFTRYTQILYTNDGMFLWYGVTTPLLNSNYVEAARSHGNFDDFNSSVIDTIKLSNKRNAIGHEWKTYNLTSGSYTVDPNMIFIIKSNLGFYYKMHFLEFYDDLGNKGYPKMEYRLL